MKSKDIRKEKQNSKLKSTQLKDSGHTYYVYYNDQSATIKRDIEGQIFTVGIYKAAKKNWIKGDKYSAPKSIKEKVEMLFS